MSSRSLPPGCCSRRSTARSASPWSGWWRTCPATASGAVIEKMGARKGDLLDMTPVGNRMKLEFLVPARGLFGYRNEFLTDTKGEGIMASVFDSYAPYQG